MGKSTLSEWYFREEREGVIYIIDVNAGAKSLTNDAENVVKACLELYGNKRIVYRDSLGGWDEMVHNSKRFTNFAPWRGYTPR